MTIVRRSTYYKPGVGLMAVAECGDQRIECSRGSVFGNMARRLLELGHDPHEDMDVVDKETGELVLNPQSIGRWARTSITEGKSSSVSVVRYQPFKKEE